jgi:cytochrome c oxidase cbb3-type subunit I/II
MLIAPSWGGMLNGLLTLRGAWDRVRDSAVLKFFVVAVTAYGMSTFEGPMLSLRSINAISHFTDWTIAHVHVGALGWNGFLTFGMLYWLFPRLFNVKLYSEKLANFHFWIGTLGILFYAIPLYFAGFTQSLMWKEFTEEGFLAYPNFLETVTQIIPMYAARAFGGTLYLVGFIVMIYNLAKTAKQGAFIGDEDASAPALAPVHVGHKGEHWHRIIERRPWQMLIWATVLILIGGIVEMVPTFLVKSNVPTIESVTPYTPLEVQGRDIYIKEGCYNCHSQMVRPFRSETARYGEYSKAGEYVYDHPFQWGSKRTGPDLQRVGGKYPDSWHYNHMLVPESMSPGSIMPAYPWLFEKTIDMESTPAKIRALRTIGTPYQAGYEQIANDDLMAQAEIVASNLKKDGIDVAPETEIVALIAYLQRLGTDIKAQPKERQEVAETSIAN